MRIRLVAVLIFLGSSLYALFQHHAVDDWNYDAEFAQFAPWYLQINIYWYIDTNNILNMEHKDKHIFFNRPVVAGYQPPISTSTASQVEPSSIKSVVPSPICLFWVTVVTCHMLHWITPLFIRISRSAISFPVEKSGWQNLKLKTDVNKWFPQGICTLEIHGPFSGDSAKYFWAWPQLLSAGSRESNPAWAMKRKKQTHIIYIYCKYPLSLIYLLVTSLGNP